MAQYTPIFEKPYENGYENLPSQNTPITAETLNDKDDAIVNIETYLSGNDIPSDAEGLSYDNTDSGLTADNVQSAIDEIVTDIPTTAEAIGYDNTDSGLTADDVQGAVDELADEKIDKTGVDVKTNTTGQFSTITGGLLESCVINLEPVQSGSGTPSPQNVRPITGHTSARVDVNGRNFLSHPYAFEIENTSSRGGVNFSIGEDGSLTLTGKRLSGQSASYLFLNNASTPHALDDLIGVPIIMRGSVSGICNVQFWTANGNKTIASDTVFTLTAEDLATSWNMAGAVQYTDNNLNNTVYPMICLATDTDSTFEPYLGKTYTISLGQTVYGGSLDVVGGSGSDEWVNIASYNGETITEPWLSSMDEYVSGGTPTTGAQVVYKKATSTSFTTTPTNIETLIGQNNVSVPLTGQSLDSLTYREVLAWDDVERAVNVKLDLSSVAPIEYTDKASQSYNQKQLFIKDNKLCQALASISSGASFTENTNFKYTTLAEIIEPLL